MTDFLQPRLTDFNQLVDGKSYRVIINSLKYICIYNSKEKKLVCDDGLKFSLDPMYIDDIFEIQNKVTVINGVKTHY